MTETKSGYRLPELLKGTILEKIVASKMKELSVVKNRLHAGSDVRAIKKFTPVVSFRRALAATSPAIIAEIKRASPSAGMIRNDFNPLEIALEYRDAGAAAISVITEKDHFHGGLEILFDVRRGVDIPLLRKDFIIDEVQIPEARAAGADAVLLIAALLDEDMLQSLRTDVEKLGMDALVEVHNEEELRKALDAGASMIGVNNRDLRTFDVSLDVSLRLGKMLPPGVTAVAESGIRTAEDIRRLSDAGFQGFLVGEHLMRTPSPGKALAALLGNGG
jgi:indole-3-glycerol phosphate synthase